MARMRPPRNNEPDSAPIYVRLGMTKGALVTFCLIWLVVIIGFVRLEQISNDVEDVAEQAKTLGVANRATLKALRVQQQRTQNALREVCKQSDTIQALSDSTVDLLKAELDQHIVPERAIPAFTQTIKVFSGYSKILGERPACQKVLNP
jgi:hypothetical protein